MNGRWITATALSAALVGCGSSDDAGAPFAAEPELERFASQPMVVDLTVPLRQPGTVSVEVLEDAGVVAAAPVAASRSPKVRLRGLGPGSTWTVRIRIDSGDDAGEQRDFVLETLAPLPGFQSSFEVSGKGTARVVLFDQSPTPDFSGGGLYAVDGDGKSRFYLPVPSSYQGLDLVPRVPAGIKLLEDGRLIFTQDHRLQVVDELGNVGLDVLATDIGVHGFHHDVTPLPSGNFLVMGYEFTDVVYTDQTRFVAGDVVVEVTPGGDKVWQWSSFEHLDVQRVLPDFFSPLQVLDPVTGQPAYDWSHGNGVVYSADDDSLLISLRHQDWVLKVDRKTSQVSWRLGREGDFSLTAGRWFFHQHSPEWQPDGSLLLYDNGNGNPDLDDALERSRAVRYVIDPSAMTAKEVWQDGAEGYLSPVAGDANRLDGGNVLVLDSAMPIPGKGGLEVWSRIREVDPQGGAVFTLRTEDYRFVYRAVPSARLPGETSP